jgi:hypothetical protein
MRKLILVFFAIVMVASFSNRAVAQNTATDAAAAYATIIAPITITNTVDLNFGDVIDGTGYVTISTASVRTSDYQAFSGTQVGTVSAASFDIEGEATYTYAITLPSSDVILAETGGDEMTVNAFVSNPTPTGTLDGSGEGVVLVGATLNVVSGQAPGLYTGTFNVTVAYN